MRISIVGLGWFGAELGKQLVHQHEIFGTTRSQEKLNQLLEHQFKVELLAHPAAPSMNLLKSDVVVLNIPPFSGQLDWFKSWPWDLRSQIIFISSTSVYGKNEGPVNDASAPIPDTENAKLLLEEENWFRSFPKATIVRFGGLIGQDRHPGKVLSGKKNLTGGNWPVNLVHRDDAVTFVKLIIEKKINGELFNLVSPYHPNREKYYTDWCVSQGLPAPEFRPGAGPGKVIESTKVNDFFCFNNKLDLF